MADISFTRKIKLTDDDYKKIINSSPTDKLKKILEEYNKKEKLPSKENKLINKYK